MPAKDHADYYYVRWSAYAMITESPGAKPQRVDIAGFEVTYMLDELPRAEIYPTIGKEPRSGKEAKAVTAFLRARPYVTVEIFIRGETQQDSPHGSKDPGFLYNTDVKVFSGFHTGTTYRSLRSPAGGQVQVVGNAVGWLAALSGSSTRTDQTSVKGPGGFADAANHKGENITMFSSRAVVYAKLDGAVTDLWLNFVKKFFEEIVNAPSIWGNSDNKSAQQALARMDDEDVFPGPDGTARNHLPLAVKGMKPEDMAIFIVDQIAERIFLSWRRTDIWTALLEVAKTFMFHIVPLIDTATCAPVYGPLGGEAYAEITAADYDDVYIETATPEIVSKYVVHNPTGGISSAYDTTPRVSVITGIFDVNQLWVEHGVHARGVTLSEEAPGWLTAESTIGYITRQTVIGTDERVSTPDAVCPSAFSEEPADDYQEIYNNYVTSDLGDRYAKARMQDHLLRHRRGTVRGRFRLDVCPGSLVRVQIIEDAWQPAGEPEAVVGLANSVTLKMAAGGAGSQGHASTTFGLTHVRTGTEHVGYGLWLTAPAHPIFGVRFEGARLWSG